MHAELLAQQAGERGLAHPYHAFDHYVDHGPLYLVRERPSRRLRAIGPPLFSSYATKFSAALYREDVIFPEPQANSCINVAYLLRAAAVE